MKVKMIIEPIVTTLLKNKINYSFEVIHRHGLVSAITSLSIFFNDEAKSLLLAGPAKSLILRKCFFIYQEILLSFGSM